MTSSGSALTRRSVAGCELCEHDGQGAGGALVLRGPDWRVIRPVDAAFPAFYRLIWNEHVAEFGDLAEPDRVRCMNAVCAIERVLRDALAPAKVNIASLGNVVPHLHWHVIARFDWDSHFPAPIWASAQREVHPDARSRLKVSLQALDEHVSVALRRLV
ncbi:MAG TPA: HIT family protein [Burkholderiaceae bacterium]|jgi:diadenosine tetraphosphate (Ap4A) HIT family hydrolase|nr:HIT family protein [Burkholderiaceae bacterium]